MTRCEFEKIAKNAVVDAMKRVSTASLKLCNLDMVWFAHELGNKKCTIYGKEMDKYYAEVTYNSQKDELYVDIYNKVSHTVVYPDEFNASAERG